MPTRDQIIDLLSSMKQVSPKLSIAQQRAIAEASADPTSLPPGTISQPIEIDGVRAEWVSTPASDPDQTILYLHGGAYVIGSCNTHRCLAAWLATTVSARVLVIDYRLAPENPYPAALEDAITVYRWLLKRAVKPERLAICGDSAGGGLALAAMVFLRELGLPMPAAAVLLSPWTDLSGSGRSWQSRADRDPWLEPAMLSRVAKLYYGDNDPRMPLISPLFADLAELPPLLIQVGSEEILLDDSTRLAARAEAAGVTVKLDLWQGMWHVWQLHAATLPEGMDALEEIGNFIRAHMRRKKVVSSQ